MIGRAQRSRSATTGSAHAAVVLATTLLGALTLIGAFALAGCNGSPPDDAPDISGTIARVDAGGEGSVSILVESAAAPTGVLDQAVIYITNETTVEHENGSEVPAHELRVDDEVDVWFTGPVRESYPVQADAEYVVLR